MKLRKLTYKELRLLLSYKYTDESDLLFFFDTYYQNELCNQFFINTNNEIYFKDEGLEAFEKLDNVAKLKY